MNKIIGNEQNVYPAQQHSSYSLTISISSYRAVFYFYCHHQLALQVTLLFSFLTLRWFEFSATKIAQEN